MRCRKHPADLSRGVGVCAACLRERLSAVVEAQKELQPPPPQVLSFPRSVSPYVSRRKSDNAAAGRTQPRRHRFFSTPQVGPTGSTEDGIVKDGRRKGGGFISMFLGFFRSKPERWDSGPGPSSDPGVSTDSCSSSIPWFFPSFISGRRKTKDGSGSVSVDECKNGSRQRVICRANRNRGMSPVRCPDDGGYSSESPEVRKPTPSAAAQGRRGKAATPSLRFCLSPLVRASPSRQRNQKGVPPETGEYRAPAKQCIAAAAAFCKNRSRKLADFGRRD